ncbi:MAG: hypothetical protein F9B45_04660 [Phycisphaera sp. RhM]|nr:hypothetical protein [Phycisphaera sp. RhM]
MGDQIGRRGNKRDKPSIAADRNLPAGVVATDVNTLARYRRVWRFRRKAASRRAVEGWDRGLYGVGRPQHGE